MDLAGLPSLAPPCFYKPGDALPVTYNFRNRTWRTLQPIDVQVNGVAIRIPAGWDTDLASVPRIFRGLVNTFELGGLLPPILHDLIYRRRGFLEEASTPATRFTRRAADRLFREAMKAEGVGFFKRTLGWVAVRAFGWFPWPPSRSFLSKQVVKALHTSWQCALSLLLVLIFNWWIWTVVPVASGLSLLKSLLGVPAAERLAGVVYE